MDYKKKNNIDKNSLKVSDIFWEKIFYHAPLPFAHSLKLSICLYLSDYIFDFAVGEKMTKKLKFLKEKNVKNTNFVGMEKVCHFRQIG